MGKKSIQRLGPFVQTSFSFFLGAGVLLVIILVMDKPIFTGVMEEWILVLYVGFLSQGLDTCSIFWQCAAPNATTASVAFFIKLILRRLDLASS